MFRDYSMAEHEESVQGQPAFDAGVSFEEANTSEKAVLRVNRPSSILRRSHPRPFDRSQCPFLPGLDPVSVMTQGDVGVLMTQEFRHIFYLHVLL